MPSLGPATEYPYPQGDQKRWRGHTMCSLQLNVPSSSRVLCKFGISASEGNQK